MRSYSPRCKVLACSTKIDTDIHINTSYISKGSSYISPTHTIHDFVLSHRSKPVMATTTTSTTDTGQQIVPRAHKISMSSNLFGLVEIVEVIRTSDQVETVNRLKNDLVSTDVDY